MAREMGKVLTADDLMGLGQYEMAAQLFAAGTTHIPATATARPAPAECSDPIDVARRASQRYGRDRGEIEAEIRKRQQPSHGGNVTSIGRRPSNKSGNGGRS